MSTNVFVRDLDLMGPGVADGRRLEVVVSGLPLFGGVADRSGHDVGECTPQRRHTSARSSNGGRCGLEGGRASEDEAIP